MKKKLLSALLSVAMLATGGIANIASAEEADNVIYVSANFGDDANAGTLSAPLKTIDAAKLKARELTGNVTVEIMEGDYRLSSTINFTADDSNVTYKAYEGAKPAIKGSVSIPTSAAKKVTDDTILAKMTENAKKDAYVINLADYGITKEMIYDTATINAQYALGDCEFNNFFVDGNSLTVAQWPNNRDYAQHNGANDATSIIYADDYCDKWADETQWWVGLWIPYDYSYFKFAGVSIDAENNVLDYIDTAAVEFGKNSKGEYIYYSKRWKAYNLLSEMDVPGEYYIDRENLKLYFYPTSSVKNCDFEFEVKLVRLLDINNAENITFDGLTFSETTGGAIRSVDVRNVDILNCTFKDIGNVAVTYSGTTEAKTGNYYTDEEGNQAQFWQFQKKNGSYDCDVENNIFMNIGSYGIVMNGAGDIDTLTPSNNYIKNNTLYNTCKKSALYCINIGGCGVTVEHNNISKAMAGGIYLNGNNHTVQYNELYNLMTELSDGGAIYQGRADVFRGSKVQYNYLHDMTLDANKTYEGLQTGQTGIYWDDGQTGMNANHNIFKNMKTAFNSNHAGDYVHSFNTSVECINAWNLIDYPHGEVDVRTTAANGFTLAQLQELIVNKELYYDEYDNLQAIAEDGKNPRKLNVLEGNLRVNSGVKEEPYNLLNATFRNNQAVGTYEEKVDLAEIFVAPQDQDYRVKSDSAYASLGVLSENFDIDLIGTQADLQLNEETAEFEKLYPAKNANIGYQAEYNFTWSDALGANKYKLTVATDKAFEDVVFEKETIQTKAVVTGLSDETVYYWKVEAENISREFANTWTSVDGVTAFGVNVSFYDDTEYPEIPANTLTSGAQSVVSNYGYQNEWSGEVSYEGTSGQSRIWTWAKDNGATWPLYPVGYEEARFTNGYPYEAGKDYVISAMVKDISTRENLAPIEFTSSIQYTNSLGATNARIFSIEGQAGDDYRLKRGWTKFSNTISIPEDYVSSGITFIGTRPSFEGVAGEHKFHIDDVYIGEEIAYDIEFSGRTLVNANSPALIDADLVNQGGTVGNLSQEGFTFIVLDEDRTEEQEGFTLTKDPAEPSKVTVSVDDTVAAGKYIILAEASDIRKGVIIEVADNFSDGNINAAPQNIIPAGANAAGAGLGANESGWKESVVSEGYEANGLKLVATEDKAAANGAYWKTRKLFIKTEGTLAEGDTYLVSSMVKDLTEDETLPSVKYTMTVGRAGFTNEYPEGTSFELTDDWQEFYGTFLVPAGGLESPSLFFGYPTWENSVTDQAYIVDNFYIAKEVASDIEITGDSIISVGMNNVYTAEVKNQLDKAFTQNQEIQWIVTDKARTTIQEGFEITGEDGNIEVFADETVEAGTYTLVAMSNGITKGFEIKVLNGFADTEVVAYADNMITDPDNINNFEHNNGTKVTRTYASGDYYAWTEQAAAKDGYWGVGSTYLQLSDKNSDLAKSFEKGKRYVISVRLKNANPDAGDTVEFAYGLNYLKEGTIAVTSTDYQTYTSSFTASLNSPSLALGFDTKVDRLAYTELASVAMDISNGGSLYVAEEAAAEIKITADNTTLTPLDSINVSAEVLNQIGEKGGIDQNVEWFVVSADRKTIIDGAKIEKTKAGAVVSIEGAIPTGKYAIVAVSDTLVKGVDIKVMSDYSDTEAPQLNENLFVDANCAGSGWASNATWGYTAYSEGRNGGAIKVHSTKDIAVSEYNTYWATYGIYPTKFISDDKTSLFEAGENYVFSIWAKDIKQDEALPYSKLTMAFMCNTGKAFPNEYPQGTSMTLTGDWQEFKATFTVPSGYKSYSGFTVGYPTTEATTAGMAMALDDAYLAKEQAYSMEITGDNEIAINEDTVISAKLLNQIGEKGGLSQNFNWTVLNADRTAYAEGITVEENADGTVTVKGVKTGTYTLIAMAESLDFVKGYTIKVAGEAVEEAVEKISSAVFEKSGTSVNFKATVENTDAEKVFFVIGEFNGKSLVKTAKSVVKAASDANCDLTLDNVTEGNTIRAFIWNNGTLLPIDNVENFALEYVVTE